MAESPLSGRPRVLVSAEHYLPGFKAGGALRSIANLVDVLGGEIELFLVTTDRDAGDSTPYPGVASGDWTTVGKAKVMYLPIGEVGIRSWKAAVRGVAPQTLYLNSFFSPRFTLVPLLIRRMSRRTWPRTVLAPRGELSVGALSVKSFRKRLWIRIARWTGIYGKVLFHASSELEAAEIRRALPGAAVETVIDPPSPLTAQRGPGDRASAKPGPLRLVFLSRISPTKNLLLALRALRSVSEPARFSIAGPVEDANYWRECEKEIRRMPSNVEVVVHGPIPFEQVPEFLAAQDVFLFPTLGENYGHVILEALASGCFVLLSDRTIWGGVASANAGMEVPLTESAFAAAIERLSRLDESEWEGVREACREFAEDHLGGVEVRDGMWKVLCGEEAPGGR